MHFQYEQRYAGDKTRTHVRPSVVREMNSAATWRLSTGGPRGSVHADRYLG
jgi:hypothetical protein